MSNYYSNSILLCFLAFLGFSTSSAMTETASTQNACEQALTKGEIVAVRHLANGVETRVLRHNDGSLQKELCVPIEMKAVDVIRPTAARSASVKASSSSTLYESFEDWDGSDADWIPSNWSRTVSDTALINVNGNSTWHATTPGVFDPAAPDGSYVAACNWAVEIDYDTYSYTYYDQDEWLISPSFTVGSDQVLTFYATYAPIYLFNLNKVDWDTYEFTSKETSLTLQVYVREDGGEWVELLDLYDLYEEYDFMTLLYDYSSTENILHAVSLTSYEGKTVQVAFRAVGVDGNTIAIDAVKVATAEVEALYRRPDGGYYWGFSKEHSFYSVNSTGMMLVPAYSDLTWENLSEGDITLNKWSYDDGSEDGATSTDTDLVTRYERDYSVASNWYSAPTLTALAAEDGPSDSYSWNGYYIQAGGQSILSSVDYGVGTYDYKNEGYSYLSYQNSPLFGYSQITDYGLAYLMGLSSVHEYALGNYFEKPERPYYLSEITAHTYSSMSTGAVLKLSVIAVDDDGVFGDTIATATADYNNRTGWLNITNYFAAYSFIFDETFIVDSAIYVSLEGFDDPDNVSLFAMMQSSKASVDSSTHGYFEITYNGSNYRYPISLFKTSSNVCYASFLFNLHLTYPWFELDEDDVTLDEDGQVAYEAASEGETKTFNILAYEAASAWTVDVPAQAAEWLSVTCADAKAETDTIDGRGILTFTIDANDTGETRTTTVTAGITAASQTFVITQPSTQSGISSATVNGGIKVSTQSGDIAITAPDGISSVEIYNTTGQLLKRAQICGSTVIDGQPLQQGVYLLRFSDGTTVKTVK